MSAVSLNWKGGDKFARILQNMAAAVGKGAHVNVGFLQGATYPDGTSVASVAFWNEFGTINQVPRPFFRRMIAANSKEWGTDLAVALRAQHYKADAALTQVGIVVKGELVQSIVDFTDPPLKPSTIKAKGFGKPLYDTGLMQRSVDLEVKS